MAVKNSRHPIWPCCDDSEHDRLSALPEDLILHIFSFLDATYVALAPTLSRKFRSLNYSIISSISFNIGTFLSIRNTCRANNKSGDHHLHLYSDSDRDEYIRNDRNEYKDFMYWFLSHRLNPSSSRRWITFEEQADGLFWPIHEYESSTKRAEEVEVLKFDSTTIMMWFRVLFILKPLKELHLTNCKFMPWDTLEWVAFTSCVNLKLLVLVDCYGIDYGVDDEMKNLHISAPNLAKLEISYTEEYYSDRLQKNNPTFVISSPKLNYFTYSAVSGLNIVFQQPGVLLEQLTVKIDFFQEERNIKDPVDEIMDIIHTIKSFSDSGTLYISNRTIECLYPLPGVDLNYLIGTLEANLPANSFNWIKLSRKVQNIICELGISKILYNDVQHLSNLGSNQGGEGDDLMLNMNRGSDCSFYLCCLSLLCIYIFVYFGGLN